MWKPSIVDFENNIRSIAKFPKVWLQDVLPKDSFHLQHQILYASDRATYQIDVSMLYLAIQPVLADNGRMRQFYQLQLMPANCSITNRKWAVIYCWEVSSNNCPFYWYKPTRVSPCGKT